MNEYFAPALPGNDSSPHTGAADPEIPPSGYDNVQVAAWIACCRDVELAHRLIAIDDLWLRGCETVFAANYYPTRFGDPVNAYAQRHPRAARLTLPFDSSDYDGITFER